MSESGKGTRGSLQLLVSYMMLMYTTVMKALKQKMTRVNLAVELDTQLQSLLVLSLVLDGGLSAMANGIRAGPVALLAWVQFRI